MKAKWYVWAAGWMLCLAGFAALGLRAATGEVWSLDLEITRRLQDGPGILAWPADAVNWLGSGWRAALMTALLALALLLRREPIAAGLVAGTFVPRLVQHILKGVFSAPRPTPDLVRVTEFVASGAYPSGHTVGTAVLFALAFLLAPRLSGSRPVATLLRAFSVFMLAFIGVARVWVGAHWPADVVGGYLFAALYVIPASRALTRDRPAAG